MKTNARKLVKTFFCSVLEHEIKPCFLIVFAILLNGCGNKEMAELKRYTKSTLAKPGRPVEPLPPIKPFVRDISIPRKRKDYGIHSSLFSLVFLVAKHRRHLKTMAKIVTPKKY